MNETKKLKAARKYLRKIQKMCREQSFVYRVDVLIAANEGLKKSK